MGQSGMGKVWWEIKKTKQAKGTRTTVSKIFADSVTEYIQTQKKLKY